MTAEGPSAGRSRISLVARQTSFPFEGVQQPNTTEPAFHHDTKKRRRKWSLHLHLRDWDDDDDNEQTWWFASTAIPLLAATLGPLANVFSIAALVTQWRMCLVPALATDSLASQCRYSPTHPPPFLPSLQGHHFPDPPWCSNLNILSLTLGFAGNFFLLCNFTQRIRYIIALPATITFWSLSAAILIGLTAATAIHGAPTAPQQQYSQGFWYAVMAACVYVVCAVLLMVNMLGFFRGRYPERFALTDAQRTLILQTMLYFFWLAGGAAVFDWVEGGYGGGDGRVWGFVNALYFCDVTVLTIGFGDVYPTSDVGRGLVFPYSVGGIIMLGLMVSSIHRFAKDLGSEKIVRRHVERSRARTIELDRRRQQQVPRQESLDGTTPGPMPAPTITILDEKESARPQSAKQSGSVLRRVASLASQPVRRRQGGAKLLLLREEKDRFDAMREIQKDTAKFKRWYALSMSVFAFGLLWCLGALVFMLVETERQLTYFQALYFCYVSLLTVGYGDLAPISNAGRPFFVFWSIIAVPTMTILISDLGNTLIDNFVKGTSRLADFTVLPRAGAWRSFLDDHPWIMSWVLRLQARKQEREAKKRVEEGFQVGPAVADPEPPTLDELAGEELSNEDLARKLPAAIRRATQDMKNHPNKKYSYEDWVEFTQLIRFTTIPEKDRDTDDDHGLIEWDWIGEDSPMMSKSGEAEFVVERLLESMNRYIKQSLRGSGDNATVSGREDESRLARSSESSTEHDEDLAPKDEPDG